VYDDLIPALATAIRITCRHLTVPCLQTIGAHVEQGIGLPRKPGWERKAAAHAQLYRLLADAANDPVVASVLRMGTVLVRDLAVTAGPGSDGMITNAHRRLLAHLSAADADAAEHEAESYLRTLNFMSRLASRSNPNPAASVVS
jgi:DNA-binding FadR family transcriptional regulator